jgi:hypothetical protein
MKKLNWYFKHGTICHVYSVLYEDDDFILVQNDETQEYSFGLKGDFGTFWGFPVNQSCLSSNEAEKILTEFIEIDKKYLDTLGEIAANNIRRWKNMILGIKAIA